MYQPTKDMKSLTFCSIYKESFNIISSNPKLFSQISIFFALPLSIITLLSILLSSLYLPNTPNPPQDIYTTPSPPAPSWELAAFLIYKLISTALTIALSLLTFSSLTYAAACIYTDRAEIDLKATFSAFKRTWKKLFITRLVEWVAIVGFTLVIGIILVAPIWAVSTGRYQLIGSLAIFFIALFYFGALVYITVAWIFGGAVAVLESLQGFKALNKSRNLIKGKAFFTIMVLCPIIICNLLLGWMFLKVVVNGGLIGLGVVTRVACGVAGLPAVVALMMVGVVVQTVVYLVCKADKGESISKSNVMDHLDIYVDGYALAGAKDEQI